MTVDEINYSLSRFICEVRKVDGSEYPADTLYSIIISIQLHLEKCNLKYKLLCDTEFQQIHHTLDNIMKQRAKSGVGQTKKQAQVITVEEEDALWRQGILGTDTPSKLLHTLFYLVGVNFVLRGSDEHRNLRNGPNLQIHIVQLANDCCVLRYTEDTSKTNQAKH